MMTIDDAYKSFREYLQIERGLSKNTIESYFFDLQKYRSFVERENIDFLSPTLEQFQLFFASLYDANLHRKSVARTMSGIKTFYRFLKMTNAITSNPVELMESPLRGKTLPEVLTLEEIDAILSVIDVSTAEGTRNYAIIETLYSCGLRVSELINLRFQNIYFKEGFIRVLGKGNKQRLVPLSDTAIQKIDNYLAYRRKIVARRGYEDVLFLTARGKGMSRVTVFYWIKVYAEKAGITKVVGPHTFRHSFATHLLERGANIRAIQDMMGHADISSTEIYTNIDTNFIREEIIEHHPRNKQLRKKKK